MDSNQIAKTLEQLLEELSPEMINEMSEEDILNFRVKLNPYGRIIQSSDKILNFSFTNLKEEYIKKLVMTGMIGYLNAACNEYKCPDGHPLIDVYSYVKNPEIFEDSYKNWTMTDKITEEIAHNKAMMEKRVIIKEFLEDMFQYNPNTHVRSVYKPNPKDIARNIIDTPAANLAVAELSKRDMEFREKMIEYDRLQKLIAMKESAGEKVDEELANLVAKKLIIPGLHYKNVDFENWSQEDRNLLNTVSNMIPPADIFSKFKNYYEINYDKLREAVLHLYCDKAEFDIALLPYSMHDSQEEAEDFKQKHRDEVITDIFSATSGKWNFFAPFSKVRESMKFFNKDTAVLEGIATQIEADAKIGSELLKNKIKLQKQKNIIESGPDAELFSDWRKKNSVLKDMKAITLDDDDRIVNEAPDDGIAVNVFRIGDGGMMKKDHFYTKAVAPVEMPNELPGPSSK